MKQDEPRPRPGRIDPLTALLATPAFDPASGHDRRQRPGPHRDGLALRRPPELTARTYTQTVARALGVRAASQIVRRPDWAALQAALRRAEIAGHDVEALLARPSIGHGLDRAASPCLFLDRRITEHLADHPDPALAGVDTTTSSGRAYAWTHLAWAMKAAENHGTDPAALLPAAPTTPEPAAAANSPSVAQAWLHAQAAARQTRPGCPDAILPWVPAPVPGTVTADHSAYLTDVQHLVAGRVAHLRARLTQALTDRTPPAWTQAMGHAP